MENRASANANEVPSIDKTTNYKKIFKIIVIGESNVGKTSLTYRFCEGAFLEQSEATIGVDFRSRNLTIDGEDITLQLWDTAGQERFRSSMVKHYYRNTHAIVLVYDVTNAASFDSLKKWVEECNRNCLHDIPRILVGNKCDGVAAVTTNVAQRFADQYNMPLFETSARLDSHCDNIEAIFLTLAHKLKSQKPFLPVTNNIVVDSVVEPSTKSWRCC
ncbi:ras-related protein Rab-33B-like [Tribolium madens]|uniref:ras-related protein Rab-33B-like n=1 Tax=Tribolium madens TaxID=41895 RepID=UPI001CF74AF1|nr:ras-related protein Rab-33B-like [Tribolium madens]XP_044254600.1 ras-related protein Rab-33B-like [Tribolium madens]